MVVAQQAKGRKKIPFLRNPTGQKPNNKLYLRSWEGGREGRE
jgi:hypothetical protein